MIRMRIYLGTTYLPHRNLVDNDIALDAIDIRVQSPNEEPVQCELTKAQFSLEHQGGPPRDSIKHRYRLVTLEKITSVDSGVGLPALDRSNEPADAEVINAPDSSSSGPDLLH